MQPAPLPRIVASMLYDLFLLFAVGFAYSALYIAVTHLTGLIEYREDFTLVTGGFGFRLGLYMILAVFYVGFWLYGGQTLGMRAWRLKLVAADGGPVSLRACLVRIPVAFASLLCLGLGYLWALVDRQRLTIPDRVSRTRLILLPRPY